MSQIMQKSLPVWKRWKKAVTVPKKHFVLKIPQSFPRWGNWGRKGCKGWNGAKKGGRLQLNAVPREMIFHAVHEVCKVAGYNGGAF